MAKTVFICLVSCLLVLSLIEVQGDSFALLDSTSASQSKCQNGPIACSVSNLLSDLSKLLSYSSPKNQADEDVSDYVSPKNQADEDFSDWVSISDRRLLREHVPPNKTSTLRHIVLPNKTSTLGHIVPHNKTSHNKALTLGHIVPHNKTSHNKTLTLGHIVPPNKTSHNKTLTLGHIVPHNKTSTLGHIVPPNRTSTLGQIVVDKYGSAPYKTINRAIQAAMERRAKHNASRITIYVKKGFYEEAVVIPKNLTGLMLIGDGINATVIAARNHVKKVGEHIYTTATATVEGDGFIAKSITFRNEAGPGSQAIALYATADKAVFYKCSFEGFQDTLFVHSNRQFFSKCDIYGTTDFIFGGAKAVFQDCNIYVRRNGNQGENFIASPGGPRTDAAIVIQNSRIRPSPELVPVVKKFRTYLGRPWREYTRLVYIECDIGDFIDPQGWFTTRTPETKGIHFVEYLSYGRGSNTSTRFRGASYEVATRAEDVRNYTVGQFLNGNSWIPESNVSFVAGLGSLPS